MNGLLCREWFGRGRSGHGETNEETIAVFPVRGNVCQHQVEAGYRVEEGLQVCSGGRMIGFTEADRDEEKEGLNHKKFLVLVLDG